MLDFNLRFSIDCQNTFFVLKPLLVIVPIRSPKFDSTLDPTFSPTFGLILGLLFAFYGCFQFVPVIVHSLWTARSHLLAAAIWTSSVFSAEYKKSGLFERPVRSPGKGGDYRRILLNKFFWSKLSGRHIGIRTNSILFRSFFCQNNTREVWCSIQQRKTVITQPKYDFSFGESKGKPKVPVEPDMNKLNNNGWLNVRLNGWLKM